MMNNPASWVHNSNLLFSQFVTNYLAFIVLSPWWCELQRLPACPEFYWFHWET